MTRHVFFLGGRDRRLQYLSQSLEEPVEGRYGLLRCNPPGTVQ